MYGREGDDHLSGRGGDDELYGEGGRDDLFGGVGNDFLSGGTENDRITGGIGADEMNGGDGFDMLSYAWEPVGVNINLATNVVSGGNATGDTIKNFEGVEGSDGNDTLTGNQWGNTLVGRAGDDHIFGNGGNDQIEGGSGNDVMTGSGAVLTTRESDTFIFGPTPTTGDWDFNIGHDVITDYDTNADRMDVRGLNGIDSMADVTVTQMGRDGTLVSFDGTLGDVFLRNVSASSISATDFIF
jgi:Ca2+-binding RTX toxin-like protein